MQASKWLMTKGDTMTITAEITERGDIALLSEFRDKDLIKTLPGTRWDAQDKVWRAPLSWSICKAMRGVFRERLQIGPRLTAWAFEHRDTFITPAMDLRLALDHEAMGEYEPRLFDFQRGGVGYLAHVQRALLGDEMGSGKTVQTAVALRWLNEHRGGSLPLLIVCPNSMKRTWERELNTWFPGLRIGVIAGGATARRKIFDDCRAGDIDVVIMHWEVMRLHSRLAPYGSIKLTDKDKESKELNLIPWKAIVLDEAHKMKNPKSQQTRATWAVCRQETVQFKYALTGTPIANAPHDLWAILHALAPEEWPSKTRYVDRYCLQSWNAFGGLDIIGLRPDTAEEFYAVVDPYFRRMPKALVLSHLPPVVRQTRFVEMSPKQLRAYEEMATSMVTRLDNGDTVITTNPIAQLTRLVQFSSAYAELNDEGEVRLTEPSNKVDALIELVNDLDVHESVVVFAQSRQLVLLAQAALEKAGITTALIIGGQNDLERQANIDSFQNGDKQVILCTVQAGGVGVTLTRARILVFLQRDFSLVNNVQAEARVHRIGSEVHESVLIVDLVSEGTVDEHIIEVLVTKQDRLEEIVRDRTTLASLLRIGSKQAKKEKKRK